MRRLILALLVCGLAVLAWWFSDREADRPLDPGAALESPLDPLRSGERALARAPDGPSAKADAEGREALRPAQAADRDGEGALVVRVTRRADAAPVAHVGVSVHARDGRVMSSSLRVVVSDGEGLARFEGLRAGPWRVQLDRGPSADCQVLVDQLLELAMTVDAGVDALVRVLDAQGARVPGAAITLWASSRFSDAASEEDGVEVGITDGNGELLLAALPCPAGTGAWVAASHATHGATTAHLVRPQRSADDHERRTVELRFGLAGATLQLHVMDSATRPLAGARVQSLPIDEPGSVVDGDSRVLRHLARHGRSDALGLLTLAPFAPGDWRIEVAADGYERQRFVLRINDESRLARDVVMPRAARVHGRVTAPDGAPIEGADVQVQVEPRGGGVSSAPDGRFALDGLSPGDASFLVEHERFETATGTLALARDEERELAVTLTPRPVLRGRLVDEREAPLPGLGITANALEPGHADEPRTAISGATGEFELLLRRGVDYALLVRESGHAMPLPIAGLDRIRARDEPLVIPVPDDARASAWVEGWLVDAEQRPALADRYLSVIGERFRAYPGNTMPPAELELATGRFRIGPLPAGRYTLTFAGQVDVDVTVRDVILRPRETISVGRVVVPASGELEVALELEPELRVAELSLQIDGDASTDLAKIDPTTLRARRSLLPGRYRATVFGTGFRWLEEPIEIFVGETTRLRGTLRAAVRVGIRLVMPKDERRASFTIRDARGAVAFDAELEDVASEDWWPFLDRGTFHVEALGGSGRRYATQFTVDSLQPGAGLRELRVEPVR